MRYPGGKGQAGVYQKIINLMPPHDVYVETHLGGGQIFERKKPARSSIGIDIDAAVVDRWSTRAGNGDDRSIRVICDDASRWLLEHQFAPRTLVYSDPPYMLSTRKGGKIYRHEMTDDQHRRLLSVLLTVPAAVMISGYRHPLYDAMLPGWRRVDFPRMDRGGTWAVESLWMNYEPPAVLHDFSFLGENFRERERIKRKRARWRARLEKLPASERAAMLEILLELASPGAASGAGVDPRAISDDGGSSCLSN